MCVQMSPPLLAATQKLSLLKINSTKEHTQALQRAGKDVVTNLPLELEASSTDSINAFRKDK